MKYTLTLTVGTDEDPKIDEEKLTFEAPNDEAAQEAFAGVVAAAKMEYRIRESGDEQSEA